MVFVVDYEKPATGGIFLISHNTKTIFSIGPSLSPSSLSCIISDHSMDSFDHLRVLRRSNSADSSPFVNRLPMPILPPSSSSWNLPHFPISTSDSSSDSPPPSINPDEPDNPDGSDTRNPPDPAELQSKFLHSAILEYPEALALRERALPTVGGVSFVNIPHTDKIISPDAVNRQRLLEFVKTHLETMGMFQTAEILCAETGLTFQQMPDDPMEPNLTLLISTGMEVDANV
jgi:hypothetical protein